MTISPLFFSLIRVGVANKTALPQIPNEDEWRAIFTEAQRQALVGIMYLSVERLPAVQKPPKDILLNWYALAERIKRDNQKLNSEAARLASRFKANGRRYTILKGQGVALLYPNPLLRMAGDIDIWVEGKRASIVKWLASQCAIGEVVYHNAHADLSDETTVEVHFTPSWAYNYFRNRRWQRFFRRKADEQFEHEVVLPQNAGTIAVPTTAFNRVYLLMHIYRHLFDEGIGLRQLLDYYYCLRQPIGADERTETRRLLCHLGLQKFAGAVMYVEQEVFGLEDEFLPVPPDVKEGRFLLSEIMAAGNFGQYDLRNRHSAAEGHFGRFFRKVKRNIRFVRHYPDEALWSAPFKVWHFFWRGCHGYFANHINNT